MQENVAVCEIDDYPYGGSRIFDVLDEFKLIKPDFKVTLFSIPFLMSDENYLPIHQRNEWVKMGVHGFHHKRGECIFKKPSQAKKALNKVERLPYKFEKIFKPRSYAYSIPLVHALRDCGYTISLTSNMNLLGNVHHYYHRWITEMKTDIKIKATYKNSQEGIVCFYGHVYNGAGKNDNFLKLYERKFKRQMANYNFKLSEDIAIWI